MYPCQSVGQWVIVSDFVIAIASPSFASLFNFYIILKHHQRCFGWKVIQVHLADDDPISALEDAMAVLKNHPDDFTTLCIKVALWETWASTQMLDHFQARCFFFLGQFEKSLLVWTQANRIRTNNKEVLTKSHHIHFRTCWKTCQSDMVCKCVFQVKEAMDQLGDTIATSLRFAFNVTFNDSRTLIHFILVIRRGYFRSTAQPIKFLWYSLFWSILQSKARLYIGIYFGSLSPRKVNKAIGIQPIL